MNPLINTPTAKEEVRASLEREALDFVSRAMRLGYVVHIYQQSQPPLAMGRYGTVIDVRAER